MLLIYHLKNSVRKVHITHRFGLNGYMTIRANSNSPLRFNSQCHIVFLSLVIISNKTN